MSVPPSRPAAQGRLAHAAADRGTGQRVGDRHPAEAQLRAEERRADRVRPARRVGRVVGRVRRVRQHDHRDAVRDRRLVGAKAGSERPSPAAIVTRMAVRVGHRGPIPGKCFIVGRSPPASSPDANAFEQVVGRGRAERPGPTLLVHERGRRGDVGDRREVVVDAEASERGAGRLRPGSERAACCRALPSGAVESVGGAQGTRLTEPPSWSVAISSRGWPPFAAAACSVALRARRAAAVVMLAPKRITPPTSPRRMRPSRSALGVVPAIATMSFWPMSWAAVGPGGGVPLTGVARGVGAGVDLGVAAGQARRSARASVRASRMTANP